MAEAAIRAELAQLRGAVEAMRVEHDALRDRDERVANRLGEIERIHAERLVSLEAAYVALAGGGGREEGGHAQKLRTREAEKFMPEMWTGEKGACPFSDFAYEVGDRAG
eukprot:6438221-Heterocapsa_arctica.AAC.2